MRSKPQTFVHVFVIFVTTCVLNVKKTSDKSMKIVAWEFDEMIYVEFHETHTSGSLKIQNMFPEDQCRLTYGKVDYSIDLLS